MPTAASMKQGRLRFPSRRAASSTVVRGGKQKALSRASSADATTPAGISDEGSAKTVSRKRKADEGDGPGHSKAKRVFDSREGEENSQETASRESGAKNLLVSDARWTKAYVHARDKMGDLEPIHAQDQNRVHHVLRVFDLSYEYGPCVGVTRLERWERADALGLEPPSEVKDILLTKEGLEQDEYKQCVFHAFGV